jgi:hypothetical protein
MAGRKFAIQESFYGELASMGAAPGLAAHLNSHELRELNSPAPPMTTRQPRTREQFGGSAFTTSVGEGGEQIELNDS